MFLFPAYDSFWFWILVVSICATVLLAESITLFLLSHYTHQAHWKRFCSCVPFAFAIWFLIEVYRGWSVYKQWASLGDYARYHIPLDQMAMIVNHSPSIRDQGPLIVTCTFVLCIIGMILMIVFLQNEPILSWAVVLGLISGVFPTFFAWLCIRHEYDIIHQLDVQACGGGMMANGYAFESWFHWALLVFWLSLLSTLLAIIIGITCKSCTQLLPTHKSKNLCIVVAALTFCIGIFVYLFFTMTHTPGT